MIHLHRKFKMFNIEHARQQFLTEHPEIKFIRNCNPLQNSEIRQELNTLICIFANFLRSSGKSFFVQGRLDTGLRPHAILRFCLYFLIS